MLHNIIEYYLTSHKIDVIDNQSQKILDQDVRTLINIHKLENKYANVLSTPTTKKRHILLLYEEQDELDKTIITYLNDGLARGQSYIYVTFDPVKENYENYLELKDCQKNIKEGNLVMINLALYR